MRLKDVDEMANTVIGVGTGGAGGDRGGGQAFQ